MQEQVGAKSGPGSKKAAVPVAKSGNNSGAETGDEEPPAKKSKSGVKTGIYYPKKGRNIASPRKRK